MHQCICIIIWNMHVYRIIPYKNKALRFSPASGGAILEKKIRHVIRKLMKKRYKGKVNNLIF